MQTISRRDALQSGASALALAPIPAAALTALPAAHPDAKLDDPKTYMPETWTASVLPDLERLVGKA